jgi:hypothetical protein
MAPRASSRGRPGRGDRAWAAAALWLAALACAPRPGACLFGGKSPEAKMIDWMIQNGGEVRPPRSRGPPAARRAAPRPRKRRPPTRAPRRRRPARRAAPRPHLAPPPPRQANAVIETRGPLGVRGTWATKDIPRDGTIAKIPMNCSIWWGVGGGRGWGWGVGWGWGWGWGGGGGGVGGGNT